MTPTATPEPAERAGAWRWALPIAAVLIAVVAGAVTMTRSGDDGGSAGSTEHTATNALPAGAVEVTSDAPAFGSLQELVDASDLIVRGRISGTERGRWFGDGGEGARIESRLATLKVDEILRGEPEGEVSSLLVEEEGWTEDGEPLVIDGAVPTRPGDEGIWFLVDTGDDTTGSWIVVNAQGRYLQGDGKVVGARGGDPLVAELSDGSLDDLADQISRTRPRP